MTRHVDRHGRKGLRQRWRPVLTAVLVMVAVTVAVLIGVVVLLAAAAVTADPRLFVPAGVVGFVFADAAGAALVARRASAGRRRATGRALFASSVGVVLALLAVGMFRPAAAPAPRAALPAEQLVSLPDGSRLLLARMAAPAPAARAPIVVLHGGPGVPDLAANAQALAPLTALGSDVILYAQLGSDHSTRLSDPSGYSLRRDTADLEALRDRLGVDRMILVGHSYGGLLAATYLAAHPDRVQKLILISPAPLDPADHSPDRATASLNPAATLRLYTDVLAPRTLLGYALLQINPGAAHALLPDPPADARNDIVVETSQPALFCPGDTPPDQPPVRGTGFYAMQYPQSATAPDPPDPRPALTGQPIPTLIVKGRCDYLSWHSALDYRRALPDSALAYLPNAGHNLHQERPVELLAAARAFLDNRPLPPALVRADPTMPDNYQGPP